MPYILGWGISFVCHTVNSPFYLYQHNINFTTNPNHINTTNRQHFSPCCIFRPKVSVATPVSTLPRALPLDLPLYSLLFVLIYYLIYCGWMTATMPGNWSRFALNWWI
ncbi:hypothetical protein BDW72DRAFT_13435 [Aspergillus terricola var. indicus]